MVSKDIVLADAHRALAEDVGSGDVSALLIPAQAVAVAEIISREAMLVCGQPWVQAVFHEVNPKIRLDWLVEEGAWLPKASVLCRIEGLARDIVTAERAALNFLQTLSATATQTHHYVQALKGTKTTLLDTRKTLPGLRYAQKYAVALAGGCNHRMGLYDAFLIKENHIKACGSIALAIQNARHLNPQLPLEIEVENLQELSLALNARPDRIMLDNFTLEDMRAAVSLNQGYQIPLEVSGGVSLASIREIAETGVDFISVGAITKSVTAIDLSLLVRSMA